MANSGSSVAEEVDANGYAADRCGLPRQEHAIAAGLASDHVKVTGVLQSPADGLYVAQDGGRTRRSTASLDTPEPGRGSVATDLELDLEELLPRLFGGRGGAHRSRQERLPLPLLLSSLGLLGALCLLAGLLRITLTTLGCSLFGTLEHRAPVQSRQLDGTAPAQQVSDICRTGHLVCCQARLNDRLWPGAA